MDLGLPMESVISKLIFFLIIMGLIIPLMNYFNYGMSKVRINLARNTAHSVIKSALFYLRKKAKI